MSKFYTLLFVLFSFNALAVSPPEAPNYGKLVLVENRAFKPHFEAGIDLGMALDNSYEDVYSFNILGQYNFSPLWSLGIELTGNKTEDKDLMKKLRNENEIKITNYTPTVFSQIALRFNAIKGHLNILNKWNAPFEIAAVLGGGIGYNDKDSKSSSLASWGGEFLVPVNERYKVSLGVRHYKSYPFQTDELSFTSFLLGIRRSF